MVTKTHQNQFILKLQFSNTTTSTIHHQTILPTNIHADTITINDHHRRCTTAPLLNHQIQSHTNLATLLQRCMLPPPPNLIARNFSRPNTFSRMQTPTSIVTHRLRHQQRRHDPYQHCRTPPIPNLDVVAPLAPSQRHHMQHTIVALMVRSRSSATLLIK